MRPDLRRISSSLVRVPLCQGATRQACYAVDRNGARTQIGEGASGFLEAPRRAGDVACLFEDESNGCDYRPPAEGIVHGHHVGQRLVQDLTRASPIPSAKADVAKVVEGIGW